MIYNNLILGAAILFAANLVNRILGFIYQYLIMNYIGSEAYGLFHMVFPIYMTALVFTTAGLPLAISKMVAEKVSVGHYADAQKIFRIALITLFLSGMFVSIVLFCNTSFIVNNFFADQRVYKIFQICTPAIFIVSIASAFRGYFQGLQNMFPSALSQVCEQIFRVIVGFTIASKLLVKGVEWAAVGIAAGMLFGEILGLGVISINYLLQKTQKSFDNRKSYQPSKTIFKNLLTLSLPVTGSRLMATGLSSLDAIIIPKQLQKAGYDPSTATSLFGQFSGTAMTLLNFPSVFTFALSTSLVPAISEAIARNDYKLAQNRCTDSIKYTIIIGVPSVITLFYFAEPLAAMFKSQEVTNVLKLLAFGGLFAYVQQTTIGILQGLGKTYLPLIHTIISSILRIPLLFYLTGTPQWGLLGSSWAYIIGFFCLAMLNIRAIINNTGMKFDCKVFIYQPFSAGVWMIIIINLIKNYLPATTPSYLIAIFFGFLGYIIVLKLNGGLNLKDLKKIPLFNRFIS